MTENKITRRSMLVSSGLLFGLISLPRCSLENKRSTHQFRFCLNTGTIRGHNIDLRKEMELVSQAGYHGIEIWVRELKAYLKNGGSLTEIKDMANDLGLVIENAISFARWIVDETADRQQAQQQIREEMDLLRQIGCSRIAAPPVGATTVSIDLYAAAERYAQILEIGEEMGVVPQLEVWGFSTTVRTVGEALFIAAQSGHADACLLLDVYHLHRGGSPFSALKLIDADALHIFHMNDYPGTVEKEQLKDSHRVYPGDGDAPFADIIPSLCEKQKPMILSLELFNQDLWAQEVDAVLETGLAKMKSLVASYAIE